MLRQQIDIPKQPPVPVKRLAKARGDSEAEIIRPAIEREVLLTASQLAVNDRSTLEEFQRFGFVTSCDRRHDGAYVDAR